MTSRERYQLAAACACVRRLAFWIFAASLAGYAVGRAAGWLLF